MAKVLITLLGTGKQASGDDIKNRYETTDYFLENKLYKNLTFTSNAIIEHFNIDKVFYIGTNLSMWDNIAEFFKDDELAITLLEKKDAKNLSEEDLKQLNHIIDDRLANIGSKCFIVQDGEDEEELWSMFDKFLEILDEINDQDEVYFDITHLFRSVSVMSFIIAEFGQTYKDFQISGFFYGMLKKDEPSKIIDVSMFFELLEWAKAIEEVEKFASMHRLINLANGKIQTNGYNNLKNLNDAFSIANMSAIYQSIKNLKNHLDYFYENDNKIIKLVSPRIEQFIKDLNANTLSEFQFKLAEFFADKNYYSLAYIALAEAIISLVCEKKDLNMIDKQNRQTAKKILYDFYSYPNNTKQKEFIKMYDKQISNIRNNIAHQLETTKQPKDDIKNFKKYFQDSKQYLKEIF